MRQGLRRNNWAALTVAAIALFAALGGSVYAAKKRHGIGGRAIRVKSLPGNRVKPKSLPGNRLKLRSVAGNRLKPHSIPATALQPGVVPATQPSAPLTGATIDETTLGRVPEAAHAETADTAQSAVDAQTALDAVNAGNAQTVNGHSAGCEPGTTEFAGACWQTSSSFSAATAPQAAIECAQQGGTLPQALQLAALAQQPGINLDEGDEWSGDIVVYSGPNTYGVATVSTTGGVNSVVSTEERHYRCVIPLLT
jgi:hypothetical protein